MSVRSRWLLCTLYVAAASAPAFAQQPAPPSRITMPDFTHGPHSFPNIVRPYEPTPIPPSVTVNAPRLHELIRDGVLKLSLSDALALVLENNLDISVQRFVLPIAETDLLRTKSGQAARGVPGALVPSGLSQGALGVGVNAAGGVGGVGAAGGISGGGGAVSIGQSGNFDPAVAVNASYDHTVSPLNSVVVAGVPTVTTISGAGSVTYAQMFHDGSSFTIGMTGIAQHSTQQSLLFNPAVVTRLAAGGNKPLLSGAGFLANERFLMVAANNLQTSRDLFTEQVITTVVQVEDAYWNLVAARQAIDAAQEALTAAQRLVSDTTIKVRIGTAARVDIASVQSSASSAERDLVIARTTYELQESTLKNMLSMQIDPELDRARVDTTDPLPVPTDAPPPDLDAAERTAFEHRPELAIAARNLKNQDISVAFTRNGLLPVVSVFGLYAGAGLAGDSPTTNAGFVTSFTQDLNAGFPEYAAGVSAAITLRNRSAQADSLRARLEGQQQRVQMRQTQQQIGLEVRQAIISLTQGRSQVESAREAERLAAETLHDEQVKFDTGLSTPYNIILRERDVLTARQASLTATAAYARALVDFDRATGQTLEHNGVRLADAIGAEPAAAPTPAGVAPAATNPTPGQK